MKIGNGNKVVGLGFTGVRRQTVSSFGILWVRGVAEIRGCEFWDNGKAIALTGTDTTRLQIHSTTFNLNCKDSTCSSGVGIDFLRDKSYKPVVDATDLKFVGKGTAIKVSVGIMRVFGITASEVSTVFDGGASSYGDFELEVENGIFTNNTRVFYSYGFDPKLYNFHGRVRFENCHFERGHCESCDGPAIRAGKRITVAVNKCTFTENDATPKSGTTYGHGGAFYCQDLATINIVGSSFTRNKAIDGSPGWCDPHCGFVASDIQMEGNSAEKDTGKCAWRYQ
mmetsp:Transcript_8948/g.12579  ORF Transcript_8948/g.12579 Transcript_8948/m.12579 type:complete len:282 (-) Transcript_8948:34-879(-)